MATSQKPKLTIPQIEDKILSKIFLVTLTTPTTDSRIIHLKLTANELLSESKPLLLNRNLIERVLNDRLSNNYPNFESLFYYLFNCYNRSCDEAVKVSNIRDSKVRFEILNAVETAKKLCVCYCRMHLNFPDMFVNNVNDNYNDNDNDNDNISPILSLIFDMSDVVDEFGSGNGSRVSDFVKEFFLDTDYESVENVLSKVYEDLRGSVMNVSVLGDFQKPLKALKLLVKYPVGAKGLVSHKWWVLRGRNVNGRFIEMASLLGPFFKVSALVDHPAFKSEPDVGEQCFSEPSTRIAIKTLMNSLYDGLAEVLNCLLKNTNTRQNVLEYLAEVINKNSSRSHMQVDPMSTASSGMFVNLSAVMLRLCEPFLDDLLKMDRIDPNYVFHGRRLELRGLTALHASSEEVSEWINTAISESTEMAKYSFICESFFMTARVLNLGLLKSFSDFERLAQDINRKKDMLSSLEAMQQQAPSPQQQEHISSIEKEIELLSQEELCYEAQIFQDEGLLQRALSYYRLMTVWLVQLGGGFRMPLPTTCPMKLACVPEFFVEDILELLMLASRCSPKALDGVNLIEFMNFIIMFMGSPEYIRNPYIRAKMVEVLRYWVPRTSGPMATKALFEGHLFSLEYLVKNLLKLYVDIEFTGAHNQFYDKFNIRHNIAELLEYLWQVPGHRNVWMKIAKDEEKGVYLNFLNFLINDSIFLLDESLNKIIEHKELEAEMSNTVEWGRRTAEERQERIQLFRSQENIIRSDMQLANKNINMMSFTSEQITAPFLLPEMVERVASMLNYFLLRLAGPQRKSLTLKDPEKYKFRPKVLLEKIVTIYVHLVRGDKDNVFPSAIINDSRSYSEQLFEAAGDVLRKIGKDGRLIREFLDFGAKTKAAALEAMDAEASLGDVPDEFLDPIQYSLMKDPVILPSSKVTVDRPVIERHLLSANTDPFNRSHLTRDMLISDLELKARIREYIRSQDMKRHEGVSMASESTNATLQTTDPTITKEERPIIQEDYVPSCDSVSKTPALELKLENGISEEKRNKSKGEASAKDKEAAEPGLATLSGKNVSEEVHAEVEPKEQLRLEEVDPLMPGNSVETAQEIEQPKKVCTCKKPERPPVFRDRNKHPVMLPPLIRRKRSGMQNTYAIIKGIVAAMGISFLFYTYLNREKQHTFG